MTPDPTLLGDDTPVPTAGTLTYRAGEPVTYTGNRVRVYGGWFDTAETEGGMIVYIAARHAPKLDMLTTGETQQRLPGDAGQVRDLEIPTPQLADLPFALTPTTHDASDAAQGSLWPAGLDFPEEK